MSITICTYNVHSLKDSQGRDNVDRIVEFLNKEKPDVLCLQEISGYGRRQLQPMLGYKNGFSWAACSILTNLPLERVQIPNEKYQRGYHPRFLTVKLALGKEEIYLTCCHLDYKDEPRRMSEMRKLEDYLRDQFEARVPQIWTGDFNSLTREDYTDQEWEEVSQVRRKNRWELPKTEVI